MGLGISISGSGATLAEGSGISCVVADDHPIVLQAFALLLPERGIDVVAEAATGTDALAAIEAHKPKVAVLDSVMPRLGGIEVVKQARSVAPETAAILYAERTEPGLLVEALDAGAAGFALKESPVTDSWKRC